MSLNIHDITHSKDDDELFEIISAEMSELMPDTEDDDIDKYIDKIRSLPKAYWAFGAIYALDVSITLDDLGWHFSNHYSLNLAQECVTALRELGAVEQATIFTEAINIVKKYWEPLGDILEKNDPDAFPDWYETSGLEGELEKLNQRMWQTVTNNGSLLDYIPRYARKFPQYAVTHQDH